MRKLLIAVVCLVVVLGAAFAGATFWVQHRAEQEIDSRFAVLRASGAAASHGAVHVDLLRRSLTVEGIAWQSNDAASVKLARAEVSGIGLPRQGRLRARQVVLTNVVTGGKIAFLSGATGSLDAPRIELDDVSVPEAQPAPTLPGPAGPFFAVFSAATVADLAIPQIVASLAANGAAASGPGLRKGEYHYAGVSAHGIADGRIQKVHLDKITLAGESGSPQAPTFSGEGSNVSITEIDPKPILLALAGPGAGVQPGYQPVYARASAGGYGMHLGEASVEIGGAEADDVAVDPTKLRMHTLLAAVNAVPPPGTAETPQTRAEVQAAAQTIATFYEGMRIGRLELHGITIDAPPQDALKIASARISDLQNGRVGELAIDGLDGKTAQKQPVQLGHFALQGIGIAELLRTSGRVTAAGTPKLDAAQAVALLRLLDGLELKDLSAPYRGDNRPIDIDTAKISWGNFVGPLPSRVRATLRATGPIDSSDQEPFRELAQAGFSNASVALDIGAAWDEASRVLLLSPGQVQIANVGALEAKASLVNVPKTAFSTDPTALILSGILVELGPIEITLHDLGGLDLAVAEMARTQNISKDEARRRIVESVTQPLATLAAGNGDLAGLADAVAKFVESPGGTLTVKVTPKGRVMLMQVASSLKDGPAATLASFHIEAGVSR